MCSERGGLSPGVDRIDHEWGRDQLVWSMGVSEDLEIVEVGST